MWPASFSLCIVKAGDIHRPGSSCTASRTEPRSEECLREFCATAFQVVKVARLLDPAQLYNNRWRSTTGEDVNEHARAAARESKEQNPRRYRRVTSRTRVTMHSRLLLASDCLMAPALAQLKISM